MADLIIEQKLSVLRQCENQKKRSLDNISEDLDVIREKMCKIEKSRNIYTQYLTTLENERHSIELEITKSREIINTEQRKIKAQENKLRDNKVLKCYVINQGHNFIKISDGYGGFEYPCEFCKVERHIVDHVDHTRFQVNDN